MSLTSENYFATPSQLERQRGGFGASTIPELDDERFGDISLMPYSEAAGDAVLGMYTEALAQDAAERADASSGDHARVIPFTGAAAVKGEVTPMTAIGDRPIETVAVNSKLVG